MSNRGLNSYKNPFNGHRIKRPPKNKKQIYLVRNQALLQVLNWVKARMMNNQDTIRTQNSSNLFLWPLYSVAKRFF